MFAEGNNTISSLGIDLGIYVLLADFSSADFDALLHSNLFHYIATDGRAFSLGFFGFAIV